MRLLVAMMLAVTMPACTSILLGDASTSERSVSSDDRSSGQVSTDNAISASIRRKIGADPAVNQYAIGISTYDSNVTLSGTVGSFTARDRAVEIATGTDGVRSVRNRIIVNTNL
jgi:osmotically-inducible protein OsmY